MSQSNKIVAKNTIILYLRMFFVMCVQLYTSRVILASLGIVDFGIYGVVGGIVVMFSSITGSLSGAVSRYLTVELGKKDYAGLNKVFSSSLLMLTIESVLVVGLCESVGVWFLYNKMEIPLDRISAAFWVLQFSSFSSFISITQVPYTSVIIAHENMKVYAYVGIFEAIAKLVVALLISINPIDKLIWYASLILLIQLTSMCFLRIYCIKKYSEVKFYFHNDYKQYKEIFSYSMYDMIGSLSIMFQGQGLNMLLNTFFGPVVNAARAIAYQVQGAANQFSGNFMTALRPRIIKLYAQGNECEMMKLVYTGSIAVYVMMFAIILPLSFEIEYILTLWLGDFPNYAKSFTVFILIASLLNAARTPRIIVFHATGKIRLSNVVTGTILCLAFPIGYVFLKMGWSPNSVFYGVLLTIIMAEMSSMFILKRCIHFSIVDFCLKVHLKNIVVSVCSIAVVYLVHQSLDMGLSRLIIVLLTSTTSIALCSWFFALNSNQRQAVKKNVKKRLKRI